MGTAYQTCDAKDSRKLAEFLAKEGQLLLPMLDLVTRPEAAVDEVIEVVGRATLEAVLLMSAEGVAGPRHPGKAARCLRCCRTSCWMTSTRSWSIADTGSCAKPTTATSTCGPGVRASGGTLTAGTADPSDTHAHFLLEQGKNMVGRGEVNGNYKNHGHVIGDGTDLAERIVFNDPWIVTGKGTFENTLILGTFAPGESPAITSGTNQGFGGTVEVELGGTTPGFGDDNHDQIADDGTILLVGGPTLEILPWNDFVPEVGDEFVVMTWTAGLDGAFGDMVTDPWFTDRDIAFDLHYEDVDGLGSLTLEAVPEPATLALLGVGGVGLTLRTRRRRTA